MESEVTAAVSSKGTLAAVGSSISGVGTATKAFVLLHPLSMAAAGGALVGIGAYYTLGKIFRKKSTNLTQEAATTAG